MRELIEKLEKTALEEAAADTTLKQLGGRNRLKAMIGAKDIFSDDGGKSLVFKFPNRLKSKPNYVKITLTGRDDYDIEFGRITKKKGIPEYKKLKTLNGVYADQLVSVFKDQTGLDLRL